MEKERKAQKEAGYGTSTCGREGQLREGERLRGWEARESLNEVLQFAICEEQDGIFGHGPHYRGGQTLLKRV
jgi:hypothetical protein